jgi:hypothetical protein
VADVEQQESGAGGESLRTQRQPAFAVSLFRFQETIDAIRQLHDEVCVHAAELDRKHTGPEGLSAVKSLDPDRREKFKEWLETRFAESDSDERAESSKSQNQQVLTEIFADNPVAMGQAQAMLQRAMLAPSRETLLRSSLLTMAVSAFEVLLGGLAARHYELHPTRLGKEKKFSLPEISSFDSLEDIQDAAIAHRIYQLLQAPFDEWTSWLDQGSGLGIKLKNLAISYDELGEIIQRRHVIVHNGGVVSVQYLDRVKFSGDPPPIGSYLLVDEEYLRAALDQIDSAGNLVGVGVWSKERPDAEPQAVSALSNRMEQLLFEGRWLPLRQICSVGKKVASLDVQRQIFKVNEWLSIKRLGGLDPIEEEIRSHWDTSALGPQFQLVQLALLDEADGFFKLAPSVVDEGGIQPEQLRTWPVFAELREDERFEALYAGRAA